MSLTRPSYSPSGGFTNNFLKTGIGLILFSWLVGDRKQEPVRKEPGCYPIPPGKRGRKPNPEKLCKLLEEWSKTCRVCGRQFNSELKDTIAVVGGKACPFCKKMYDEFGILYKDEEKVK